MRGIKATVTMERTLYVDLPDTATEEEVIEVANKEIVPPVNALYTAAQALKKLHINIPNLDLADWDTKSVNYTVIQ